MTVGEKIKEIRKSKKITQQELAEKCSLSKNALWNYENNKRTPNVDTIYKIAIALNVNINDILINKQEDRGKFLSEVKEFLLTMPKDKLSEEAEVWLFEDDLFYINGMQECMILIDIIDYNIEFFIKLLMKYPEIILELYNLNKTMFNFTFDNLGYKFEDFYALAENNKNNKSNDLNEYSITEENVFGSLRNIIEYTKLNSKFKNLKNIKCSSIEEDNIFNSVVNFLESELIKLAYTRGDNNGNKES